MSRYGVNWYSAVCGPTCCHARCAALGKPRRARARAVVKAARAAFRLDSGTSFFGYASSANSSCAAVETPGPEDSPAGSPPLPGIDWLSFAKCLARAAGMSPSLVADGLADVRSDWLFEAANIAPTATRPIATAANASRKRRAFMFLLPYFCRGQNSAAAGV